MFFKAWCGAPFRGFERKLWVSLLYVVLWSIWRIRNRCVFEQYVPNWDLELRMIKTRLGFWARGWCSELSYSPEQFVNNLDHIRKWKGNVKSRNRGPHYLAT